MLHTAYLCLGSNLGDRLSNLQQAMQLLAPKVAIRKASSVYETLPWGFREQPAFLNQLIKVETALSPYDLLTNIKNIENKIGRLPSFRYGPRSIDIDIVFYDDIVLDSPDLQIPHPSLQERAFVLAPLVEIAPDHIHPVTGEKCSTLLVKLDQSGIRRMDVQVKPVNPGKAGV